MSFALLIAAHGGLYRSPGGVLAIVVLIFQILVLFSVVAGKGTPTHKLVWSLVVLLLPVIGLIVYFAIGRSRADRPLLE